MNSKNILRISISLFIVFANIGCDRVSKQIVRQEMNYHETIHFLGNHVTLTKVENTGAFLSLGNALPDFLRYTLLMIFPMLSILFAFYFLLAKRSLSMWTAAGISFIIGGGIGNLYDRMWYGSVTDFMHINFTIFQTGIFNMADVSIMTGMFIILMQLFIKPKKSIPYGS